MMMARLYAIKMRLYVRPCHGCDDSSVHDSHFTYFGRRRWT